MTHLAVWVFDCEEDDEDASLSGGAHGLVHGLAALTEHAPTVGHHEQQLREVRAA